MRRFDYRNLIIKKLDELKISLESEIDCESAIVALKLEFIKKMACEIDDFEVIGMVGKIEVQHKKVLDDYADYLSYQNGYFSFSAPYPYEDNNYAAFCKKLEMTLSSSDKYGIDMSIYQEEVERNKDALMRHGLYRNLSKYVKNETAMDKAFQMVKKIFLYIGMKTINTSSPPKIKFLVHLKVLKMRLTGLPKSMWRFRFVRFYE